MAALPTQHGVPAGAMPPELTGLVVFTTDPTDAEHAPPTPAGALTDLDAHPPRLLLPAPVGAGRFDGLALALALGGRPAAIGPTVPLAQAAQSLRWARRALGLVERGVLPGRGLPRCADHLPALWLRSDEPLLAHLAARALAPLEAVSEAHRDRLREALPAWLLGGSSVPDTAARLHVHPQTVRYRLRQLKQCVGGGLHTPDTRLALLLALQADSTD